MTDMTKELDALFPTGKTITIGSDKRTITVTPFTFGQLGPVMKAVKPISASLIAAFQSDRNQMESIVSLMADSGDDMVKLVSVGTKLPVEYIQMLGLDDALSCMLAILEVNGDFFVRKVLPTLQLNMEKLVPSVGLTS